MEIELKEIESCKFSVRCVVNAGEILEKRGQILQTFKKAPVPGFRPGKGSIDAIKMHYRPQIEEALKRALAEDAFHTTLFEKKIKPHGPPVFKSLLMLDSTFICEFDMSSKPNFELAEYKGMEIPKPHPDENSDPVLLTEKMLQELRVKFSEAIPYDQNDFVQMGDNVIVDYECFFDGVKNENLSAEGEMLTVGHSQFTNFDENLLGMRLNDVREFDLVVPPNGLPSLIGKTAHFKITLNMGSKTQLCPLDDSLAKKMNKENVDELRAFVGRAAMGRAASNEKIKLNEAVANRLVNDNNFLVPGWLSLSEAKYLAHQSKLEWDPMPDLDKERFITLATRNVKLSLILDKIREEEPEAQLSDQEVFEIIKQNLMKSQGATADSINNTIQEMNKTGYLQVVFSRLKDEHSLDFVVKASKIVE